MSKLKTLGVIGGGMTLVAVLSAISIIAGGVSLGLTGAILAGFLHIIGVITLATAKVMFKWFFIVGAILGLLRGLGVLLVGWAAQ